MKYWRGLLEDFWRAYPEERWMAVFTIGCTLVIVGYLTVQWIVRTV